MDDRTCNWSGNSMSSSTSRTHYKMTPEASSHHCRWLQTSGLNDKGYRSTFLPIFALAFIFCASQCLRITGYQIQWFCTLDFLLATCGLLSLLVCKTLSFYIKQNWSYLNFLTWKIIFELSNWKDNGYRQIKIGRALLLPVRHWIWAPITLTS